MSDNRRIFNYVHFDSIDYAALKERSHWLRNELLEMSQEGKKGHIPSSYSCAELTLALWYGGFIRHDPKNPKWPERDRFIVSKGHAGMVAYPIYADRGFFSKDELKNFVSENSLLKMYPDPTIPGVEAITGSLSHLGFSEGIALGAKMNDKNCNVFTILSDGECYEGATWEAALYAAPQRKDAYAGHTGLNNLIWIVDNNGCCITDKTEKCVSLGDLEKKFDSFGWYTQSIEGHSYREIIKALRNINEKEDLRPSVIIANTVKGKGLPSCIEGNPAWHNKKPNQQQIIEMREAIKNNCIVE